MRRETARRTAAASSPRPRAHKKRGLSGTRAAAAAAATSAGAAAAARNARHPLFGMTIQPIAAEYTEPHIQPLARTTTPAPRLDAGRNSGRSVNATALAPATPIPAKKRHAHNAPRRSPTAEDASAERPFSSKDATSAGRLPTRSPARPHATAPTSAPANTAAVSAPLSASERCVRLGSTSPMLITSTASAAFPRVRIRVSQT